MNTPGSFPARVEVRVDPAIWKQEVERLRKGSPARIAAERERARLEQHGIAETDLEKCKPISTDGTRLPDLTKARVPIKDAPASDRPYGFVFAPGAENGREYVTLAAFGIRHPKTADTRSVYERAHKRLHGRFPDQERSSSASAGRSAPVRSPQVRSPQTLSAQVRAPSRAAGRAPDWGLVR